MTIIAKVKKTAIANMKPLSDTVCLCGGCAAPTLVNENKIMITLSATDVKIQIEIIFHHSESEPNGRLQQ